MLGTLTAGSWRNWKRSREEEKAGRGGGGQAASGEKGARGWHREISFCIANNTVKNPLLGLNWPVSPLYTRTCLA